MSERRLEGSDLSYRSEFYPTPRLRVLTNLRENVLRILQQGTLEERERTRILERDNDRYVLLQECEAGLAPLEFLSQVAIERDPAQLVRFVLPLLRVGNLHYLSVSPVKKLRNFHGQAYKTHFISSPGRSSRGSSYEKSKMPVRSRQSK